MKLDWLLLTIPTALIWAFAEPGEVTPPADPPIVASPGHYDQYDIDLAHKNIRDCNDRCSKLADAIDAINARCKCGLTAKKTPSASSATATVPPAVVVRAAQPVRQFIKKCANGVCTLVPIDNSATVTTVSPEVTVTETTQTYEVPMTTRTRTYSRSGPLRGGRLRGLLCR